jgi:hypothetical protein
MLERTAMANKPNISDDDIKTVWGGRSGESRIHAAGPDDKGRDDSDDQGEDDPAGDDQGRDDAGGDDQGRDDAGGDDKGRDDS